MSDKIRSEVARLEDMVLRQNRRIQALEKRERQREQAILEMAAALRSAGIEPEGVRISLPSPSGFPVPAEQSAADAPSTLHATG